MKTNVKNLINVDKNIHKISVSYLVWKSSSDDKTNTDVFLNAFLMYTFRALGFVVIDNYKQEGINYDTYHITFKQKE